MPARKQLPERKDPTETLKSVEVFHSNIRELFKAAQSEHAGARLTQRQFARMAGMSLRTLANILSEDGADSAAEKIPHAPTLRTIERAAKGFKLQTWQLLFPDFPAELVLNETFRAQTQEAVRRFLHASPAVRAGLAEMLPPAPHRTTG